ncbi:MAG: hypothetical protein A2W91_16100 [Bacteroidetes bacterium GWF2_38_335]|nr:MAG: hypothetical protein A2W91_16100 [Bacteroidetes bacterium GWF2_38_335]OFY81212.1 MAG: hypothetical protein A2281_07075 [Bacteroidetes bacterium RIFOXYA12_FULL_38_20]HBS85328.1 efflux transporter periplasmic adaptor subunit [Bacteroidales bacterium]
MYNRLIILTGIAVLTLLSACGGKKEDTGEQKKDHDIKVNVKTMQPEKFAHYFQVSGSVEAIEDAFVSSEVPAQIRKIHVQEGQRVSKGQVLVSLNSAVISNTIDEIETALELATVLYEKQKELWDQKIGSEVQYLQAKNGKESLEEKLQTLKSQQAMYSIVAPFSGIIDEIYLREGEMASPGIQVMQLVNLDQLNINAAVSEFYLSHVKKGDTVLITFPAYKDIVLHEPVFRTGNVVNLDSRSFKIQVQIKNREEILKPNIISYIKIKDYETDSAMVVPSIIIKDEMARGGEKKNFVFVAIEKNGKAFVEKKYIVPGSTYVDRTEVLEGLEAGDKVIVDGYQLVTSGTEVKIKN